MDELIKYFEQFILPQRKQLFEKNLNLRTNYITIVLEDLYQQHNASAVIRSCDSFGIQNLHVIENRNKFQINKEIAVGSEHWVDIHKHNQQEYNTTNALLELKKQGYRIIATAIHHEATTLEDFDLHKGKSAIVFGTELNGISEDVVKIADEFLHIPMYGFAESLNISVSAAIIINNLSTRLRKSDIKWSLTEDEKIQVMYKWLKYSIKNSDLLEKLYYENIAKQ